MSALPPELVHLSPEQIIAQARKLRLAREKVKQASVAIVEQRQKRVDAMIEVAQTEILTQYADDPVAFAREVLGVSPWSRSIEVLEAVRDNRRVIIRSGHKVAKSHTLSILALWWVKTRREGRVVLTATKDAQIRDILWREVRHLYQLADRNGHPLGGHLYETAHNGLKFPDGREIIGMTSKTEGGAPGAGGYSGTELLFIVDEGSGVKNETIEAFKGNLAGGGKLVVAGNPLVTSGFFFDAFHDQSDGWHTIKISSEESPNVSGVGDPVPGLATKEWVDDFRKEAGPEYATDPVYQTRVLGEFPSQGPNSIIFLSLVDAGVAAHASTPEDGVLDVGVDVAREGDDESVIQSKRGKKTHDPVAYRNQDGIALAARVVEYIFGSAASGSRGMVRRHPDGRPAERPRVKVDAIGVGAGCFDVLRRREDLEVYGINVSESPTSKPGDGRPGYDKLRDQLWFAVRDFLKDGGTVPPKAKRLHSDLVAPMFSFTSQGEYKVEPKKDTKKRLKRSPDHGDAFCLCVYTPPPKPKVEAGRVNLHRR